MGSLTAHSKPICNAIVWQDRRTTELCKQLKAKGYEDLFRKKTGLVLDPYFSGTKLSWILKNIPSAHERAKKGELAFGTVDSWLIWKLTGGKEHKTDATNASRTLLYNIEKGSWDDELLDILDIPKQLLPEVQDSSGLFGYTSNDIFSSSLPICGVAGDQQAALFGQACTEKGMVKNTYGTGCFLLMNTQDQIVYSKNNLLTTIAYQLNGKASYALEGSVFIAGAVVQWLRDNLGIIKNSSEIEALAQSASSSEGVYFVPAFTGLGAPYWDPHARACILGMTRGTTKAHIARAALEGIAFQVADVIKAMENDAGITMKDLRVDGGAVANNLLLQFQSDLLQATVVRPKVTELTALGASFLAGLSIGFWKNLEELKKYWEEDRRFEPSASNQQTDRIYKRWKKAIEISKLWDGHFDET